MRVHKIDLTEKLFCSDFIPNSFKSAFSVLVPTYNFFMNVGTYKMFDINIAIQTNNW